MYEGWQYDLANFGLLLAALAVGIGPIMLYAWKTGLLDMPKLPLKGSSEAPESRRRRDS